MLIQKSKNPDGEINVDYLDKEKDLIVTISDSGPDISNLTKLFEPVCKPSPVHPKIRDR